MSDPENERWVRCGFALVFWCAIGGGAATVMILLGFLQIAAAIAACIVWAPTTRPDLGFVALGLLALLVAMEPVLLALGR